MKTMKSIKTRIILTATAFITFMNITPVRADGLNIQPLKDWITSYMVPLKDSNCYRCCLSYYRDTLS